jgi:hypothetical protein
MGLLASWRCRGCLVSANKDNQECCEAMKLTASWPAHLTREVLGQEPEYPGRILKGGQPQTNAVS